MKYLKKFNEDLNPINDIISNIQQILRQIKPFGYNYQIKTVSDQIIIEISKQETGRTIPIWVDEIYEQLNELNEYLTLGESFRFSGAFGSTKSDSEILNFRQIMSGSPYINLVVSYTMPKFS